MTVVLELIGSGVDGSTVFTDASSVPKTMTGHGNAQIDTNTILLDGNGDYVDTASTVSDFAFGTNDFTIEFRAKKSANGVNGYDIVLSTYSTAAATDGYWIELSSSRGFFFGGTDGASSSIAYAQYNSSPNDGLDHHWAVCRSGTSLKLFKDGVTVATATHSLSLPAAIFKLGSDLYSEDFNGRIHDLRINNGAALYTADFTPPASPLPFNQTEQATGFTETNFGTPGSPTPQTGVTSGWLTTNLGSPRLITDLAAASGFQNTNFGTPKLVYQPLGFLATRFGIASIPLISTGFDLTQFGAVAGSSRSWAHSMDVVTQFGIPSTPFNQTQATAGEQATVFGLVEAIVTSAASTEDISEPTSWRTTSYGIPTAQRSITAQATGFTETQFGAVSYRVLRTTSGAAPSTVFGAPSVAFSGLGFSRTSFGLAVMGVGVNPFGASRTVFGAASALQPGAKRAYGINLQGKFGYPSGRSEFRYPTTGAAPATQVGTPQATITHKARMTSPSARFGTPLIERNPTC